jgi:hypothetical protein
MVSPGRSFPLGATSVEGGVNFSVFSSQASWLELLLFDRASDAEPAHVIRLGAPAHRTDHYWHVFRSMRTGWSAPSTTPTGSPSSWSCPPWTRSGPGDDGSTPIETPPMTCLTGKSLPLCRVRSTRSSRGRS